MSSKYLTSLVFIFQNIAQTAKNVKNVSKTLTERQQLRAASTFYHGMFDVKSFSIPNHVTRKKDLSADTEYHEKLLDFMGDKDLICSEIVVFGQEYKNGDLVVINMENYDEARVGLIHAIVIKMDKVYFYCRAYRCVRSWLQYFMVQSMEDFSYFVEYSDLKDFKPLIKRGTSERFKFMLHHRVSVKYV